MSQSHSAHPVYSQRESFYAVLTRRLGNSVNWGLTRNEIFDWWCVWWCIIPNIVWPVALQPSAAYTLIVLPGLPFQPPLCHPETWYDLCRLTAVSPFPLNIKRRQQLSIANMASIVRVKQSQPGSTHVEKGARTPLKSKIHSKLESNEFRCLTDSLSDSDLFLLRSVSYLSSSKDTSLLIELPVRNQLSLLS